MQNKINDKTQQYNNLLTFFILQETNNLVSSNVGKDWKTTIQY